LRENILSVLPLKELNCDFQKDSERRWNFSKALDIGRAGRERRYNK